MLDKAKFQNHVLHWLATKRVAGIAKKHKKTELYQKLKKVRLESAREDLHALRDLSDWLDLLDLHALLDLRDWRDLLDLLDWRDWRDLLDLLDWRDWRDLRDLLDLRDWRDLRDLRDLLDWRVKELLAAYKYAGGNLRDLQDKHLYSGILATITRISGNELNQTAWHTCQTTHCEAGWTVVNKGEIGTELERLVGTPTAAAMISFASTKDIPDYYELDDKKALADIKARAEKEMRMA